MWSCQGVQQWVWPNQLGCVPLPSSDGPAPRCECGGGARKDPQRSVCARHELMAGSPHSWSRPVLDCVAGARSGLIKQQLCNAFAQARWQQPSVILFDDMDLLCCSPPGPESDPYQEGPQSHKVVDCLVELVGRERQRGTACVLVATAETKEGLHPRLVGSRGGQHVFGKIAVLHPPSMV